MTVKELWLLYEEASNGNHDALVFILTFHSYAHLIDDIIDGDKPNSAETIVEALMLSNNLYSTPFFLENSARLSGVIAHVANTYLDSVEWENSDEKWKKNVADVLRLSGNDVVLAVAGITGGFKHMRQISLRLRAFCWHNQHTEVQNA